MCTSLHQHFTVKNKLFIFFVRPHHVPEILRFNKQTCFITNSHATRWNINCNHISLVATTKAQTATLTQGHKFHSRDFAHFGAGLINHLSGIKREARFEEASTTDGASDEAHVLAVGLRGSTQSDINA